MDRFTAFATLFDPATFRHLDGLGLAPGWRCWEVGAGGTRWWRFSPNGWARRARARHRHQRVMGQRGRGPERRGRRARCGRRPAAGAPFDLVHARLVLVHAPERDEALANMAAALRPGGVLLVEDADPALQPLSCLEERAPSRCWPTASRRGFRSLLAERGVDLAYGRTLPRRLREAGLVDVGPTPPSRSAIRPATTSRRRRSTHPGPAPRPRHRHARPRSTAPGQRGRRQAGPGPTADDLLLGPPAPCRSRPAAGPASAPRVTTSWWNRGRARHPACDHRARALFHPAVASWFARRFPSGPTPPQSAAWPHIAAGRDVLVASPTGLGQDTDGVPGGH